MKAKPRFKQPTDEFRQYFADAYFSAVSWIWFKITLIALIAITIVSSRIAMLNLLAYEFSAVIAIFTSHFAAAMVIRETFRLKPILAHRSPYTEGPHSRIIVWSVILGNLTAVLWLLFIPFVLIILADIVFSVKNCDFLTGVGFYLTIPLISAFFASSLAMFCSLAASSRKKAVWLYAAIVLIFVIRVVLRIARGHTIGMLDPFIGMIDLPLYSQETNLNLGFLLSRVLVLITSKFVIVLSILMADEKFRNYRISKIPGNILQTARFLPELESGITALILIACALYYQGPLGIEITRNYLEHVLNGKKITEHFIIRYPTGSEVEKDLDRIIEQHEYYYQSIKNEIGVAPKGKIRAYIYQDKRQKTFLTGVGSSVYAKPWTGEIHVEYDRNNIQALKHELVHVISAPMGVPFFGSSMLGAYGEGIAEGIEWNSENDLTYYQWAAALRVAKDPLTGQPFFPDESAAKRLLTRNFRDGGFYVGRIGMNYFLAASHTRWFLDTYGSDAYSKAYISDDTIRALGVDKNEEAGKWLEYLNHVPLTEDEIAFAEMAFAPPKFTVQVCAHEVAEHERLAQEYSSSKAWRKAFDEYGILLNFTPGNIRYGYQQVKMLSNMGEYEKGEELIRTLYGWKSIDAGWTSYLHLLEGDLFARMERPADALQAYTLARDSAVNSSLKETTQLRILILNSPALKEFLNAFDDTDNPRWRYERAKELDDGWLPDYFLGTNLVADRNYGDAQNYLLECLRKEPEYDFIRRTSLYYLGVCAYRLDQFSLSELDFRVSLDIAQQMFKEKHPAYDGLIPVTRLDSWTASCADWLEKIKWRKTSGEGDKSNAEKTE